MRERELVEMVDMRDSEVERGQEDDFQGGNLGEEV